MILGVQLYPSDPSGKKNRHSFSSNVIGATQQCTLGNCKWSIVLVDEWVPEHDLIASLGSGPEQKGRVLTQRPAERVNGLIRATQPAENSEGLCQLPVAASALREGRQPRTQTIPIVPTVVHYRSLPARSPAGRRALRVPSRTLSSRGDQPCAGEDTSRRHRAPANVP